MLKDKHVLVLIPCSSFQKLTVIVTWPQNDTLKIVNMQKIKSEHSASRIFSHNDWNSNSWFYGERLSRYCVAL